MHQVNRNIASARIVRTENQLRESVGCSRLTISADEFAWAVCDMVNSEGVRGEKDVAGFAASSCRPAVVALQHYSLRKIISPSTVHKDFYGRNSLLQVNGPGSDQKLDFRT